MRTIKQLFHLILACSLYAAGALALTACGGGGGSGNTAPSSNFSSALSGIAMTGLGPLENGRVKLYTLNADGSRATAPASGPFITNANLPNNVTGQWNSAAVDDLTAFEVAVSGGQYFDANINANTSLAGRELLSFKPKFTKTVAITPITHALLLQAKKQMTAGTSANDALDNVITSAQLTFGFNVIKTQPSDPFSSATGLSANQQKYTALLGGINRILDPSINTKLALFKGANRFDLVLAFAQDLADGALNGKDLNGQPILLNGALGQNLNFPSLSSNGFSIDTLFTEAHAVAQLDSNLTAALSNTFPGRSLVFNKNNNLFSPQVTANNGDRQHPSISWIGQAKSIFVIRTVNNMGQNALGAWNIAVNSGGFSSPVTYFTPPLGILTRLQNMTNNGLGEPNLATGVAYQITVILVDGTVGTTTYTP